MWIDPPQWLFFKFLIILCKEISFFSYVADQTCYFLILSHICYLVYCLTLEELLLEILVLGNYELGYFFLLDHWDCHFEAL